MKNAQYYWHRTEEQQRPCLDKQVARKVAMVQYLFEIEDGFVGSFEEYEELLFNYMEANEEPNRAFRRTMKRSK